MTATLTIGTRRITVAGGYRYTGQLRNGRTVLAECGHEHDNRNQSTRTSGESATDCITMALRALSAFAASIVDAGTPNGLRVRRCHAVR